MINYFQYPFDWSILITLCSFMDFYVDFKLFFIFRWLPYVKRSQFESILYYLNFILKLLEAKFFFIIFSSSYFWVSIFTFFVGYLFNEQMTNDAFFVRFSDKFGPLSSQILLPIGITMLSHNFSTCDRQWSQFLFSGVQILKHLI